MNRESDATKQASQRRGRFPFKHGYGPESPTYRSWMSMKGRVKNAGKRKLHACYIGVTICDRWLNSFENFLADMGERPAGKTLDRIDSSKGYEPGNVRWADWKTQGSNRACVRNITYQGRTQNPEDWAAELGLKPQTIRSRLDRGWPLERVLKPGKPRQNRGKLTPEKVVEIRRLYAAGKRQCEIGRLMGLKTEHVHSIVARTSWRHLP